MVTASKKQMEAALEAAYLLDKLRQQLPKLRHVLKAETYKSLTANVDKWEEQVRKRVVM